MSITQLREPLKTWFEELDKFAFSVTSCGGATKVGVGIWSLSGLPPMDPDDARELVAEMNKAVLPIIQKFRTRKLEEFLKSAQVDHPAGLKRI